MTLMNELAEDMPVIQFTAEARCDRCGAQAYSQASRNDVRSELLFCAHHRNKHYDELMDDGWTVLDDVEALDRLYNPRIEETV